MSGEIDPAGAEKNRMEREIEAAMMTYWQGQQERIIAKITPKVPKDRKALSELPDVLNATFWDEEIRQLLMVLSPIIRRGAEGGVGVHMAEIEPLGIAVDWTLPHTQAADWARKYSGNLVKGITKTTKERIRGNIVDWMDSGEHLNALTRTLMTDHGFSRQRAQLIAATETTKAYARGQIIAAQELESGGWFESDKEWQTARDDIVCPICQPLDMVRVRGTKTPFDSLIGPLQSPPAHPGCRCGLATRPVVPE